MPDFEHAVHQFLRDMARATGDCQGIQEIVLGRRVFEALAHQLATNSLNNVLTPQTWVGNTIAFRHNGGEVKIRAGAR